jgi:hypothetical protein
MATLIVHQATPDDAAELARLLDLFDHMGATPEQVAARMLACQNVLTTFIGELDGRSIGFACLRLIPHLQGDEPYAELTDIYGAECHHYRASQPSRWLAWPPSALSPPCDAVATGSVIQSRVCECRSSQRSLVSVEASCLAVAIPRRSAPNKSIQQSG